MKYILVFLLIVGFGCKPVKQNPVIIHDTILVPAPVVESKPVDNIYLSNDQLITVLNKTIDSLKTKLTVANYKIENIKHYLAIVTKNKSQEKFLKGWIRRVVE
jgi:hypothetical protein